MTERQMEMPMFDEFPKPKFIDESELLKRCHDQQEAIIYCVTAGNYKNMQGTLADQLGIARNHFSMMMNKKRHFPAEKRAKLMWLCGNFAPLQYEWIENGFSMKVMRAVHELAA